MTTDIIFFVTLAINNYIDRFTHHCPGVVLILCAFLLKNYWNSTKTVNFMSFRVKTLPFCEIYDI